MAKRKQASKNNRLARSMRRPRETRTPIGTDIYLPNHSGDHSKGRILTTPTTDYELVNKKYVDDKNVESFPTTFTAGSVVFSNGTTLAQDNSNFFWDDTNNRLGIGTNTLDTTLHVHTTTYDSTNGNMKIGSGNNDAARLHFINKESGAGGNSREWSIGVNHNVAGMMEFMVGNASTTNPTLPKMSIDRDGQVGIGTITQETDLHIVGADDNTNGQFKVESTGNDARMIFKNTTNQASINYSGTTGFEGFRFMIANSDKVIIDENGRIGIGTTAPTDELHVEGGSGMFGVENASETRIGKAVNLSGHEGVSLHHNGTEGFIQSVDAEAAWHDMTIQAANIRFDINGSTDDIILDSNKNLVMPKTTGVGIKVEPATATFPWRDIIGRVISINTGASKPTLTTYRDTLKEFQFAAGDEDYFKFHIPHDYVAGTDIHIHIHWSHNGTNITGGTITFTVESSYSKGHNQAAFPASVSGTFNGTASSTQYQHILSETQLSASNPTGLQLDTDDLEPDGIILMRVQMTTNGMTVSSGGTPDPFIHFVDIHYQSTNIGTKEKDPDFYR